MKGSFQIAEWQVEPEINCLRKEEEVYHLEPKVMQVLVQLASHPKEVLSKERLIQAVWPDTFVSDDVLTRCISVLRKVMDDDPHAPKFIQTIPKAGYRLLVDSKFPEEEPSPVLEEKPEASAASSNGAGPLQAMTAPPDSVSAPITSQAPKPWNEKWLRPAVSILFALLVILSLALWWTLASRKNSGSSLTFRTVPFTSYEGQQMQPAFSPDGNRIVFVWDGRKNDTRDLYIKQIGSETPYRLTKDGAAEFSPTWSPDGSQIAYLSSSDTDKGLYLIPSLGGPARKVFSPVGAIEWDRGALSWSPDGKSLIFPDGKSVRRPSSLYMLSLASFQAVPITNPPSSWDGDLSPAYSPDGQKIAFVRALEGAVRDIYVMATGSKAPPKRLTFDNRNIESLTWDKDSQSIIFSSDRGGKYSLWRISLKGGEPQRLPMGTEDAFEPTVSHTGQRLAYAQSSAVWSILKYQLQPGQVEARPSRVVSSTQQDSAPSYSPDGRRIAFQSWRSGAQEIWIASADGSNLEQITSFSKSLSGSPVWSPDGKQIAFDSRPEGRSHIYLVVPNGGGAPRQITDGNFNDILPRWSADGQALYFSSNRSGSWQIWKVSVAGGTPQQITSGGGFVAAESADGNWIYYTKPDAAGIWRIASKGGSEIKVVDEPKVGYWGYWSLSKAGIYYLDLAKSKPSIDFLSLENGKTAAVLLLERRPPVYSGISICEKDSSLVITDESDAESHITLIEEFR